MGLTRPRAAQIYDIDYKQAVRVITTTNITLSGGAPTVVDGVTLSLNDRILVTGQSTASQNGIYYVSTLGTGANGTWTRSKDTDATGELLSGTIVMVTEGTTYADTSWKLTTNDPITIGTTALTFEINTGNAFGVISANGTSVVANSATGTVTFSTANNLIITGNAASDSITFEVSQSPNITGTLTVSGVIGSNLIPSANITYNLGNTTNRWKDIWLSNSTIYLGNAQISANATSLILTNPQGAQTVFAGTTPDISASTITATGNITGGNLITSGVLSAIGNANVGNLGTSGQITTTGNITSAGNVNVGNAVFTTSNSAIQGWSYNSVNLSITATEGTPQGLFFGNSGASFYVVGSATDRVYQYNMSTVNMANTGVLLGNVSVASQDTLPVDLYIDSTGANLYIMGGTNDTVYQYSMSTPWNITTATYTSRSFSVTTQEATPQGIWFKPDLTTMYVVGNTNDTVYQYSLSSAGNVATASYASKSFSVATQSGTPVAVQLSTDGSTMWILSQDQDAVFEYNLSTPWDVSTASYTAGRAFGFWAQGETGALGLFVDIGNSRAWMVGSTNDTIYQYDTLGSAILRGNAIGTQSSLTVGGNAYVAGRLQVDQAARFESSLTVDSTITATSTLSLTGTSTGAMSLGTSITTANASIYTGQTTGVLLVGGTSATGDINIGRSTASQSIVIGNGVTASGSTKTIDIGTLGAANSITNINIGPVAGNSTVAFLANARVTIANALSVTGNANVGNLGATNANLTAITASGNANVGNLGTAGLIVATGNVTGGNLITTGLGSIGTTLSVTGNANVGNLGTAGLITATGNVTGGNLVTGGQLTASGNITGNYLLANITFASGYNTTRLFNGTSEANIGTSGGNANITIGGVSNVAVFSTVGANITGTLGVTGNVTGGNVSGTLLTGTLTTAAQPNVTSVGTLTSLTATGNVTGGNLITTGTVSTGTLTTSGNATVAGNLTVSGNVISVNVTNLNVVDPIIGIGRGANDTPLTTNDGKDRGEQLWYYTTSEQSAFIGYKNSTGKLIAATNVSVSGEVVTVNSYGNLVIGGLEATTISATGNANVGNLGTAGQITATGNITGGNVTTAGNVTAAYFLGNVSQASGIFATKIFNGTSEANIVSSGGNLAVTIGSTPNVMVVSSTGVAVTGTSTVSGNANVGNLDTSGLITATGNVTGGNLVTSGLASIGSTLSVTGNANVGNLGATNANLSAVTVTGNANVGNIGGTSAVFTNLTGTLTTAAQPNITSVGTLSSLSVTGNITGGNLSGTLVTGTLTTAAQPNVTSVGSLTSLTVTGNANVGNLGTSGLITATGNVTGGNLTTTGTANIGTLAVTGSETIAGTSTVTGNITGGNLITAGLISATGNITGGNILGNGRSLTGINAFSTISITGQSDVVADNIADTLTLVAGNNISITTNATTDTITISYSSGGTGQSPFLTNPNDFGLITEAYTDSQDLGSITEASSQNIDLGTLVTSGLIYPDQLVLPTYTVATLPSATIPAQFIYVSNAANGAITAFSDGTNWRRTSDRSIVT